MLSPLQKIKPILGKIKDQDVCIINLDGSIANYDVFQVVMDECCRILCRELNPRFKKYTLNYCRQIIGIPVDLYKFFTRINSLSSFNNKILERVKNILMTGHCTLIIMTDWPGDIMYEILKDYVQIDQTIIIGTIYSKTDTNIVDVEFCLSSKTRNKLINLIKKLAKRCKIITFD